VTRLRTAVVGAVAASIACIAVAAAAAALSPGVYEVRIAGATPAALNGTWRISFAAGQYEITRDGAIAVDGAGSIRGNHVVFRDKFGPFRCLGAQASGTYRWTLSGKKLTFAVVRDPCAGRKTVLTHAFTKSS